MAATTFPAIIASAPAPHPEWSFTPSASLAPSHDKPRANEVLVRMVATGVCHTDVWSSSLPEPIAQFMGMSYPRILGHEGAGYIEAVGTDVTVAKPGDTVLLSYDYCNECVECRRVPGRGTYCDDFNLKNTTGVASEFKVDGQDARGKYFGQSSFAKYSLVEDKCVVNVTGQVKEDDLKLLAPLGCGLMTGSGAIVNVLKPAAEEGILITGIGAVGLGAVMAAKIQGVKDIVVLDRVKARLDLAKELGATHVVDTTGLSLDKIAEKIKEVTGSVSPKHCVETTGVPGIVEQAMQALAPKGIVLSIGIPPLDGEVKFKFADIAFQGKKYQWNILGDSISRESLPMMIKWWKEGKFPVEKLCKFFKPEEAEKALAGMEDGTAIKPVIVW
jgi:Zn-dependent alcohol dehydrogenase